MFKNTLRNRRRSALTIGSIAASFCLLGVMFALYTAFFLAEPAPGQELRLITRNRVSLTQTMPASYKQKIAGIPGVRHLYISQWYGGVYKDATDQRNFFARFAVEPEDFFKVETGLSLPEDQKQAFIRERTACIAGKKLAAQMGWNLGDRIVLKGDIFPGTLELTLRGIYANETDEKSLQFNLEYLYQSLPATRRDFAGTFSLLTNSKDDVARVQRDVDEMFRNATVQTRTETEQAFLLSFTSFLGNVKLFLFAICAAVTFTILLVSANTMAMSVRERVREVGVMKTVGFTQTGVLLILLGEAMIIGLIGAGVGCVLAAGLTGVVRQVGGSFSFQLETMTLPVGAVALCLGLGAFIGLIAALLPATGASRTPIIDSLKYTG